MGATALMGATVEALLEPSIVPPAGVVLLAGEVPLPTYGGERKQTQTTPRIIIFGAHEQGKGLMQIRETLYLLSLSQVQGKS